jgi:hypothetical protein
LQTLKEVKLHQCHKIPCLSIGFMTKKSGVFY